MIDEFVAAVIADGGQAAHLPDAAAARTHVAGLMGRERTLCFWDGDPLVRSLDPATLGTVTPPAEAYTGSPSSAAMSRPSCGLRQRRPNSELTIPAPSGQRKAPL